MAHIESKQFCLGVKQKFPAYFKSKKVLDIGSGDINGNNRFLFSDGKYVGVDVAEGPNVDIVAKCHELKNAPKYDTIISTECFEHDMFYPQSLEKIVKILKKRGLFLFTCATTGRPEHGTRRIQEDVSLHTLIGNEEWSDYYKNLTEADIRAVLNIDKIFSEYRFVVGYDMCDLYFYGFKR